MYPLRTSAIALMCLTLAVGASSAPAEARVPPGASSAPAEARVLPGASSAPAETPSRLATTRQPTPTPAASSLLLLSRTEDPLSDARYFVDFIGRALGSKAPLFGEVLAHKIETLLSESAGPSDLPLEVEPRAMQGHRFFIEGEFARAIVELEAVRTVLLQRTALVSTTSRHRDTLHRVLVVLSHAYLRTGDGAAAVNRMSEAIRSFPEREISVARYGPELAKFFEDVRRDLFRQKRFALHISTRPPGCAVFLNERPVGISPVRVPDLAPGRYRIFLQRDRTRGRVNQVEIAGVDRLVQLNFGLESVLRTDPTPSLVFPTADQRRREEATLAATIGRSLAATSVLLISLERYQGRRALLGTTVSSATGRVIRSALVVVEPTAPSPSVLKAFGRFLLVGEEFPGMIIPSGEGLLSAPNAQPVRDGGVYTARVMRWVTLGVALGALASGITLLALDGRGTCQEEVCPELYETRALGVVFTAAGGLAATGSGALFYLGSRRETGLRATFAPTPLTRGLGLTSLLRF